MQVFARFNHRKKMHAEPSWQISRKSAVNVLCYVKSISYNKNLSRFDCVLFAETIGHLNTGMCMSESSQSQEYRA